MGQSHKMAKHSELRHKVLCRKAKPRVKIILYLLTALKSCKTTGIGDLETALSVLPLYN